MSSQRAGHRGLSGTWRTVQQKAESVRDASICMKLLRLWLEIVARISDQWIFDVSIERHGVQASCRSRHACVPHVCRTRMCFHLSFWPKYRCRAVFRWRRGAFDVIEKVLYRPCACEDRRTRDDDGLVASKASRFERSALVIPCLLRCWCLSLECHTMASEEELVLANLWQVAQ